MTFLLNTPIRMPTMHQQNARKTLNSPPVRVCVSFFGSLCAEVNIFLSLTCMSCLLFVLSHVTYGGITPKRLTTDYRTIRKCCNSPPTLLLCAKHSTRLFLYTNNTTHDFLKNICCNSAPGPTSYCVLCQKKIWQVCGKGSHKLFKTFPFFSPNFACK
jgi:hypothetical protein